MPDRLRPKRNLEITDAPLPSLLSLSHRGRGRPWPSGWLLGVAAAAATAHKQKLDNGGALLKLQFLARWQRDLRTGQPETRRV